jgi:hypothetical protein
VHVGYGFCGGLITGVVWPASVMEGAGVAMEIEGWMLSQKGRRFIRPTEN